VLIIKRTYSTIKKSFLLISGKKNVEINKITKNTSPEGSV
jgi:hypothetical protein